MKRLAGKYAEGDYEGFQETHARQVPAKRMGTAFVLFLASKEASYITGTELLLMEHLQVILAKCEFVSLLLDAIVTARDNDFSAVIQRDILYLKCTSIEHMTVVNIDNTKSTSSELSELNAG